MFDYRRLTSCFKSIYVLLKLYLRSTVGQIRLCSIAIINIEKFYANHILWRSMDRIIDILEKEKIMNLFYFKHLNIRFDLYMF